MEQLPALNGVVKEWNSEKGVYETAKTLDLSHVVEFGNIIITITNKPPLRDPFGDTSITLDRKTGITPEELHIYELRNYRETPKRYIVGKTIMKESPFYFDHFQDLIGIQIFRGDPQKHPEMLEITPITRMGENPNSPLL